MGQDRIYETTFIAHPDGVANNFLATVAPMGYLRTELEPVGLFYDAFDTTQGLDTTTRWTTSGTAAPTIQTGALQLTSSTTASASSALNSKPLFLSQGLNFLAIGFTARFENAGASAGQAFYTGAHRFMGWGVIPTTWVAAYSGSATSGPLNSGMGFEIDTDGLMYPVVYDNGVRVRATLTNGQTNLNVGRTLANGQLHQFGVVRRADSLFWYVDGITTPVAVYSYNNTGFSQADISQLPIRLHQINGTTALTTAPTTRWGAVGIGDTGRNSAAISDAQFPWRRATVTRSGSLAVEPLARPTYTMGLSGMAATNVGVIATVTGSATRVVRIARVSVVCIAGASTNAVLKLERLSAIAAGTTSAATIAAHDGNNAVYTASATGYTAAPTTATTAQYVHQKASAGTLLQWDWLFGDIPEQQPTLRGTGQIFALRNMVAIGTSGAWHLTIQWTEELEAA